MSLPPHELLCSLCVSPHGRVGPMSSFTLHNNMFVWQSGVCSLSCCGWNGAMVLACPKVGVPPHSPASDSDVSFYPFTEIFPRNCEMMYHI